LAPSVRGFARATSFRAAAYQSTADEGTHLRESAAEVKATRRKLTIPVVVVTAGRDNDAVWRDQQRDQVGLSQHGCQVIAEQSGHGIALGQPQAVVDAIRAIVDTARGRKDVAPCG
jgi:pimeloyl-ACP methyl ester carboxylesterase